MFMGEYEHTIDAKGRVILPVKFRDELGPKFVVPAVWKAAFLSIRWRRGCGWPAV